MAMIMCPGCGTSISDKALSCPQCGFVGDDPSRPISQQAVYEMVPKFQVEIDRWDPQSQSLVGESLDMSLETRRKIFGFLGNLEQLQTLAPGLFQLIKEFSNKDEATLVAHLPEEIMKMVEEGKLFFKEDANGKIMPQVFDVNGKFYKQVRLDWEQMSPDVMDTMRHLQTQVAIAMVLSEVRSLRDQIEGIRVDLQNDRLALAEGAWDKLMQARVIEDSRLRDALIVQAISSATDAKRTLMRNFAENVKYLKAHSNERIDKKLISPSLSKINRGLPMRSTIWRRSPMLYVSKALDMPCSIKTRRAWYVWNSSENSSTRINLTSETPYWQLTRISRLGRRCLTWLTNSRIWR